MLRQGEGWTVATVSRRRALGGCDHGEERARERAEGESETSRGRDGAEEKARGVVVASVTQASREVRGAAGARALSPSSAYWQR